MKMSSLAALAVLLVATTHSLPAGAQGFTFNPFVESALPAAALNNIQNAERVFCYTVEGLAKNKTTYTLNQTALTGFCGVLQTEETDLITQEFFANTETISTKTAQCTVSPRVMLRFIRGVDSTDVLLSYPCPSLTVFYGGTVKSFNATPVSEAVSGLIEIYEERGIDFVSPALLNQLFPVGVALNDEQKELLDAQNKKQPQRNWKAQTQPSQKADESKAPKGWGKINIDKKN